MSWLSKWWKNGGRESASQTLRNSLEDQAKKKALEKLRRLIGMLDKMDVDGARRELNGMIKYVESL
jgi:hypothetical protein